MTTSACTRCRTALEEGDLRCAICALPVPLATEVTERPARVHILRCNSCNAAVAFDPEKRAPHCGFCGSTMTIEQPVDPIEAAAVRIPFAVTREGAEASLRGWLGKRGYFAPAALREEAVLESLTPLCWAGWLVSAQATVAWTADSDEGAKTSAWAPHSGQLPMRFEAVLALFLHEGVDTEAELRDWLWHSDGATKLRTIQGIGPKTADYFKILVGIPESAIDRHLLGFLLMAGIGPVGYEEAQAIINATADLMGVGRAHSDHSIWQYMSRRAHAARGTNSSAAAVVAACKAN